MRSLKRCNATSEISSARNFRVMDRWSPCSPRFLHASSIRARRRIRSSNSISSAQQVLFDFSGSGYPDEMKQLSDRDVLEIDPVVEYEIRLYLRLMAERWLAQTNDEANAVVELGRPTGP